MSWRGSPREIGGGKNGTQYALVDSSGFLTNRHSTVLTVGLEPAPLPQEFLAFPALNVLTDGLKKRTLIQLEEALSLFRKGFAVLAEGELPGCEELLRRLWWRMYRLHPTDSNSGRVLRSVF